MVISTIPAKELIELLREDFGPHKEFSVYCFILVRAITSRELLRQLLTEYASLDSMTGNRVLVVLFYTAADGLAQVKDVEREFDKRHLYAHGCRWLRFQLARAACSYDSLLTTEESNPKESIGIAYDLYPSPEPLQITCDEYFASMTAQTEELKAALNLSEQDVPCVVFIDRDLSDVGVLKLRDDDGILRVYGAIKEIIHAYVERNFRSLQQMYRPAEIEERLEKLVPLSEKHPRDRALRQRVNKLRDELAAITNGPPDIDVTLRELVARLNRHESVKEFVRKALPFQEVVLKLLSAFL